jgi:2,5-diketo-D-gluconate reductase B
VIPKLGFGTWRLSGRECSDAVADALAAGYRHIDTAAMYGNEEDVGRGLRGADVWLTTKVWPDDLEPDRVHASLEGSLRRLGADHVDLFLIHWPNPRVPLAATLEAMNALRDEGKTREIGVSNFTAAQYREALDLAPVIVNQVEYHPLLSQEAVLEVCAERDVELTAYRPLAKGEVTENAVIREMAAAHGATPAQVALAWLARQDRVVLLPRSTNPDRRRENLAALELDLTDEEAARLDELSERRDRNFDPPFAPDWKD